MQYARVPCLPRRSLGEGGGLPVGIYGLLKSMDVDRLTKIFTPFSGKVDELIPLLRSAQMVFKSTVVLLMATVVTRSLVWAETISGRSENFAIKIPVTVSSLTILLAVLLGLAVATWTFVLVKTRKKVTRDRGPGVEDVDRIKGDDDRR